VTLHDYPAHGYFCRQPETSVAIGATLPGAALFASLSVFRFGFSDILRDDGRHAEPGPRFKVEGLDHEYLCLMRPRVRGHQRDGIERSHQRIDLGRS
jgi:hypothetical protein